MSWKAVHGIQAGSQGGSGDFSSLGMNFGAGSSSYGYFVGRLILNSHMAFHASLTFARSIQQGCHLTGVFLLLLSVALLWVGAVQCAFGVQLGEIRIFFQRCSFPKPSWMLPQQACCLRRVCRGRCFLPAGRWLCEGSLKHQRRVALSRRPRREVAFEG